MRAFSTLREKCSPPGWGQAECGAKVKASISTMAWVAGAEGASAGRRARKAGGLHHQVVVTSFEVLRHHVAPDASPRLRFFSDLSQGLLLKTASGWALDHFPLKFFSHDWLEMDSRAERRTERLDSHYTPSAFCREQGGVQTAPGFFLPHFIRLPLPLRQRKKTSHDSGRFLLLVRSFLQEWLGALC